jgi:hypothetical protein
VCRYVALTLGLLLLWMVMALQLPVLFADYLDEYNVSFPTQMHLVFFKDAIAHLSRISRILRQVRCVVSLSCSLVAAVCEILCDATRCVRCGMCDVASAMWCLLSCAVWCLLTCAVWCLLTCAV